MSIIVGISVADVVLLIQKSLRRVGMGIQFETVDSTAQTLIDNFVDAHFFSNRKA